MDEWLDGWNNNTALPLSNVKKSSISDQTTCAAVSTLISLAAANSFWLPNSNVVLRWFVRSACSFFTRMGQIDFERCMDFVARMAGPRVFLNLLISWDSHSLSHRHTHEDTLALSRPP